MRKINLRKAVVIFDIICVYLVCIYVVVFSPIESSGYAVLTFSLFMLILFSMMLLFPKHSRQGQAEDYESLYKMKYVDKARKEAIRLNEMIPREVKCDHCGCLIDRNLDTCPHCGAPNTHQMFFPIYSDQEALSVRINEMIPREVKCDHCRCPFDRSLDVCPHCGAPNNHQIFSFSSDQENPAS